MTTLNLIGAGRVGRTLATVWARHGVFEILDVLTSSRESAEQACAAIGHGRPVAGLQDMRPADAWMVAVQDARIAEVASALAPLELLDYVAIGGVYGTTSKDNTAAPIGVAGLRVQDVAGGPLIWVLGAC